MPQETAYVLLPQGQEERQMAALAFFAIFGGGVIAYTVASSVRDGDWLGTDPVPEKPAAGVVGLVAGLGMTAAAANEAAKEVGWTPLVWGSVGIFAAVAVARAIRK